MDGQIDYSEYSYPELLDAADRIDEKAFPLNAQALRAELAKRPPISGDTPQAEMSPADAEALLNGLPILGWLQIAAAATLAFASVPALTTGAWASAVIGVLLVTLNISAGLLLIKRRGSGVLLSLINYSMQVPAFLLGPFFYKYTGIAAISVGLSFGSSRFGFQSSAGINPGFKVAFGVDASQYFFSLDLLALGLLGILVAAVFAQRRAKNG
jgi:hypothetical protein